MFLNSPLKEEIYIKLPPRYCSEKGVALRLSKALYGLRQTLSS